MSHLQPLPVRPVRRDRSVVVSAHIILALFAIVWTSTAAIGFDDRTAAEILADVDGIQMPQYDGERNKNEPNYRNEYMAARRDALERKAELVVELWKVDPNHDRLPSLLAERWNTLLNVANDPEKALAETNLALKSAPADSALAGEALYARAQVIMRQAHSADVITREDAKSKIRETIQQFVDAFPKDDRAPRLLASLADQYTDDDKKAIEIWNHLLTTYPDNSGAKYWPGKIRRIEGVGQPFELEFTDAINNSTIAMSDLKGKVVVVDFWATWCGPCVAEMPHMKELYAQYKDQGVEFIGVSLDQPEAQGGLERLREYCKENDINWPQYYQGNYWSSEFSVSWGINSIPTMFILAKDGTLHSTDARGKLETMIPELLAQEG